MKTRVWIETRQAYTPRWWVPAPIVVPLAMMLALAGSFVIPGWIGFAVNVVGAFGVGVVASWLQWWAWRRRHPELPTEVWVREMARRN
jgi:hypothetical protein